MDKYIYLIGGITFAFPTLVICYYRRDLWKLAIMAAICGGLAALITEPIFTRDYWLPPNILGWEHICFEDFIFGGGVTAYIATLYPAITGRKFSKEGTVKKRYGIYAAFAVTVLVAFILLHFVWGINSVVVSAGLCLVLTPVMWILRRDLIKPSLIMGALIALSVLILYLLFFDVIVPDWWDKYWLLTDTALGITVFGNVPVTELVWYGAWALFASIIWPFSEGRVLEPIAPKERNNK